MTRKKRIETAFEIARVFVYGEDWGANSAWCDQCESYVPMVTALMAATLDKTTIAAIFRRVEAKELHQHVTRRDALFVCLSSLIDAGKLSAGAGAAAVGADIGKAAKTAETADPFVRTICSSAGFATSQTIARACESQRERRSTQSS